MTFTCVSVFFVSIGKGQTAQLIDVHRKLTDISSSNICNSTTPARLLGLAPQTFSSEDSSREFSSRYGFVSNDNGKNSGARARRI